MHAYATDAHDRDAIPVQLAIAAVALTLVLNGIVTAFKLTIPWFLDAPSVMSLYGILHHYYDHYLWRERLCSFVKSEIPDLHGTWVGEIHTLYDNGETGIPAVLCIQQTWSKLLIRLYTATSESVSDMAALNTAKSAVDGLHYEYRNEPNSLTVTSMHSHHGSAHLKVAPDALSLIGHYFNGRDRGTYGEMRFRLTSPDMLTFQDAIKGAETGREHLEGRNRLGCNPD